MAAFAIMTPTKDVIFDADSEYEAAVLFQECYGYFPYNDMIVKVSS